MPVTHTYIYIYIYIYDRDNGGFWAIDHGYVMFVVITTRSFRYSWFMTGFVARVTRHVSLVEQKLLIPPEHLSSLPGFQWVSCYSTFSLLCCALKTVVCPFVSFLLVIVFSVVLRCTASDYHLDIFKDFLVYFIATLRLGLCTLPCDLIK